jgi:hypothetical protein
VHADLPAAAAFAAANRQRPAPLVKILLPEREGLLDSQSARRPDGLDRDTLARIEQLTGHEQ